MSLRRAFFFLLTLGLSHVSLVADENLEALHSALITLQADIRNDTEALQTLRNKIEEERIPLAEELDRLQRKVAGQRQEVERAATLRVQGGQEQRVRQERARALVEEEKFLRSLFSDYARSVETRMGAARDPDFLKVLRQSQADVLKEEIPLSGVVEKLISASVEWNRNRLGGTRYPGIVLDSSGLELSGTFVEMGPMAYFSSGDDPQRSGMVISSFGTEEPGLLEMTSRGDQEEIQKLISGERASVPVDPSNGDAFRAESNRKTIVEELKQGGFTMIPLGAVALLALILSLWKFVELSGMKLRDSKALASVVDAVRKGDEAQARQMVDRFDPPVRALVDDLITYRDSSRDHLEEILGEHVLGSIPLVERNLGALAVLGGVAPLLGLLGTVTGMIRTFDLVTLFGTGDASLLSGGISEALITTKVGLAIAIPTLLVHAFLSRRAKSILTSLESLAIALVNDLKLRKPTA